MRPIIARRMWHFDPELMRIESVYAESLWEPGVVHVAQDLRDQHLTSNKLTRSCPRHKYCGCANTDDSCFSGIYGLKLSAKNPHGTLLRGVIGKVALWGVVEEHTNGFRAQYAYPLSFDYYVCMVCKETPDEIYTDKYHWTLCRNCVHGSIINFNTVPPNVTQATKLITSDHLQQLRNIYL